MRKFVRLPSPGFLAPVWERWGMEWEALRAQNPGARFQWRRMGERSVNLMLLPDLLAQTQNHCSFCDNFPAGPPSVPTIEHFRPKSHFPREAYRWGNLYVCCHQCQRKGDDYHDDLLCPDAPDYEFERYFWWDRTNGMLMVNEEAPEQDRRRAEVTIRMFRLNEGHPRFRHKELSRRAKCRDEAIDEFKYRGYLEEVVDIGGGPT